MVAISLGKQGGYQNVNKRFEDLSSAVFALQADSSVTNVPRVAPPTSVTEGASRTL